MMIMMIMIIIILITIIMGFELVQAVIDEWRERKRVCVGCIYISTYAAIYY